MGLRELNTDQVHAVAAHFAVAEAIIHTSLPVELRVEERRFRLQVGRTGPLIQVLSRGGTGWQLSDAVRPLAEDTEAVVFVDLSISPPGYYPVPAAWLRADVARRYAETLRRQGRATPESPETRHYAVHPSHVARWLDRWDVLSELVPK